MEGLKSDDKENSDHTVEMNDQIYRISFDCLDKSREEEFRMVPRLFN